MVGTPKIKNEVLCGELNSLYSLIFAIVFIEKIPQIPIKSQERNTFNDGSMKIP